MFTLAEQIGRKSGNWAPFRSCVYAGVTPLRRSGVNYTVIYPKSQLKVHTLSLPLLPSNCNWVFTFTSP